MRTRDLFEFFALRRIAANPLEVLRFRRGQRPGDMIEVRMLDGAPIRLRGGFEDNQMFRRIFLHNEYRLPTNARWGCVIDLGANVGMFTVRASQLSDRVISYEPSSTNFAALSANTASRPNTQIVNAAVAGRSGTIRLHLPRDEHQTGAFSTFAGGQGLEYEGSEEVTVVTLDEVFATHEVDHCDLLKLDVEGQEYEILHAASDDVLGRVDRIHGEYHNVAPEDPRTRIDHFAAFLREKGYAVEVVPHETKANHGYFFATRSATA